MPFGEEIGSTIGERGNVGGYGSADSTRQKFTTKERDSESGLDYFGARYYSSAQGRFTSVDPFNPATQSQYDVPRNLYLARPQNWNKYSYALNNPYKFIDPDGRSNWLTALGGAVFGGIIGGGYELARQIFSGEPINLRKVGASAAKGAIFGGTVGLTGNVSAGEAAVSLAFANTAGGVLQRTIDGDPNTSPFDTGGMVSDLVSGYTAGYVGQWLNLYLREKIYDMQMLAYDRWEILASTPESVQGPFLKNAINLFRLAPRFETATIVPEGMLRFSVKAGTSFGMNRLTQWLLTIAARRNREPSVTSTYVIDTDEEKIRRMNKDKKLK